MAKPTKESYLTYLKSFRGSAEDYSEYALLVDTQTGLVCRTTAATNGDRTGMNRCVVAVTTDGCEGMKLHRKATDLVPVTGSMLLKEASANFVNEGEVYGSLNFIVVARTKIEAKLAAGLVAQESYYDDDRLPDRAISVSVGGAPNLSDISASETDPKSKFKFGCSWDPDEGDSPTKGTEPDFEEEIEAPGIDNAREILLDMKTDEHFVIVSEAEWHKTEQRWIDLSSPEYDILFGGGEASAPRM